MKKAFAFLISAALLTTVNTGHAEDVISDLALSEKAFIPSSESPEGMKTIMSETDEPFVHYESGIQYADYDNFSPELRVIVPGATKKEVGPPDFSNRKAIPLIVFVQGSAWFAQNLDEKIPMLISFAEKYNFAVATVQYRPSTVAKSPAQLQDVKSAIRYLKMNAQDYNIDSKRVGIWGDSSGGHLAALVGSTGHTTKFDTNQNTEANSKVNTVVDFYGPTDFVEMGKYPSIFDHTAPNSPESTVIGGQPHLKENSQKVDEYNPITYISKDRELPSFLIMHANSDPVVPFNQSVLLYQALRDNNQSVVFYNVQGGGHGYRFFTPAVIKVVGEFFKSNL